MNFTIVNFSDLAPTATEWFYSASEEMEPMVIDENGILFDNESNAAAYAIAKMIRVKQIEVVVLTGTFAQIYSDDSSAFTIDQLQQETEESLQEYIN